MKIDTNKWWDKLKKIRKERREWYRKYDMKNSKSLHKEILHIHYKEVGIMHWFELITIEFTLLFLTFLIYYHSEVVQILTRIGWLL